MHIQSPQLLITVEYDKPDGPEYCTLLATQVGIAAERSVPFLLHVAHL